MSAADFDEQFPGRVVLADRSHTFRVVSLSRMFVALTTGRDRWLRLQPGEVMPEVIEAATDLRVVWSSFWPSSPADTIEFDLHESGFDCVLRFRWSTDSPPDERGIGITRQRLNTKIGGDLRGAFA